jgi:excisionase family DNA binding protein
MTHDTRGSLAAHLERLHRAAAELSETVERTRRLTVRGVTSLGSMRPQARGDGNWLTLAEAAGRTGRHPDLLRRWCASRRIPGRRMGRLWCILDTDLPLIERLPQRGGGDGREATAPTA